MVDAGIPPGSIRSARISKSYRVHTARRKTHRLEKFNLTATHVILSFDSIGASETISLRYRLPGEVPGAGRGLFSRALMNITIPM